MATTEYSDFYNADGTVKFSKAGNVIGGTLTIGTALTIGSTAYMLRLPKGFKAWSGHMVGSDLDTGTEALELDVGIVGSTALFLNSGVITGDAILDLKPTVGIYYPLFAGGSVLPYSATADTDVIITVTAAAEAGGTGQLSLYFVGEYNPPA